MVSCNLILIHVLLAAALGSTAPTDSIASIVSFSDTLNAWKNHCSRPTQHLCNIWENASDNFRDKYRNQTAPEPSGVIINRCDWRCESCGANQIWGPNSTEILTYSIMKGKKLVYLEFENHVTCGCLNKTSRSYQVSDRMFCLFRIKH